MINHSLQDLNVSVSFSHGILPAEKFHTVKKRLFNAS